MLKDINEKFTFRSTDERINAGSTAMTDRTSTAMTDRTSTAITDRLSYTGKEEKEDEVI